jgi:lysozyme
MTPDKIKTMLVRHEGLVCHLYQCKADKTSIGVGRNLSDVGITEDEAMYLLNNDIKRTTDDLDKNYGAWITFPAEARMVCIDLVFNLGITGFMKFKKTRQLMELGMWLEASEELLDSRYATQLPNRSAYNSRQLALCQQKQQKIT